MHVCLCVSFQAFDHILTAVEDVAGLQGYHHWRDKWVIRLTSQWHQVTYRTVTCCPDPSYWCSYRNLSVGGSASPLSGESGSPSFLTRSRRILLVGCEISAKSQNIIDPQRVLQAGERPDERRTLRESRRGEIPLPGMDNRCHMIMILKTRLIVHLPLSLCLLLFFCFLVCPVCLSVCLSLLLSVCITVSFCPSVCQVGTVW